MTRVLTVDDSRAIRSMVVKQVSDLGFESDEAEDGQDALTRLEAVEYDLIVLDVTMPNLDGPGMLEQMRARGIKTPVLMLTSEAKKSIVASVMKQGIEDYILKPFKPEELRSKILRALKLTAPVAANPALGASMPSAAAVLDGPAPADAGRQFIDLLVIDDMENVAKKLRTMIPQHLTLNHSVSAHSALTMCREKVYRVVLIDVDIPDVNSSALRDQLRVLQPHAAFLSLCLRSANDVQADAREQGFDAALVKPFDPASVEDFLMQYFDTQDVLGVDGNIMRALPFTGKEDRKERYFKRLNGRAKQCLEQVAAACFDDAIMDLTSLPADGSRIPQLVIAMNGHAKKVGTTLKLVGPEDLKKQLSNLTDTATVPFFETIEAARAG